MIQTRAPQSDWNSRLPVFLLEIEWGARTYRFATKTVNITKGNDTLQYLGKLDEFEYNIELQRFGYDGEGDSIPFAINFDTDVSKAHADGNPIDGAVGELSFVLEAFDGEILQNHSQRIVIYRGVVSNPVFGHPNEPEGYIEFSLETKAIIERVSLLDEVVGTNGRVDAADLSNEDKAASSPFTVVISDDIIDVDEVHRGKRSPIVIGKPGKIIGRTSSVTLTTIPMSPAYAIAYSNSIPAGMPLFLQIAGHQVKSSTVTIFDSKGNSETAPVGTFVGSQNNIFSYATVDFHPSTTLQSAVADNTIEYWVAWIDDGGGGIPSPFSDGVLENGGEICLWALTYTGTDIDYDAWYSILPLLKSYKFAGFINDPDIEPLQFIESEILPFLPISIVMGPKGLKPIPNLRILGGKLDNDFGIVAGSNWKRSSPIFSPTSMGEIINQVDISYAKNGRSDSYLGTVRITPEPRGRKYEYTNDYSFTSYRLFGKKSASFECNFVYDYMTANQIARDKIREFALPKRTIEYEVSPPFGFMEIGDIIGLTDSEIHLEDVKSQVIAKRWTGSNWIFTLEIEDNKIINR